MKELNEIFITCSHIGSILLYLHILVALHFKRFSINAPQGKRSLPVVTYKYMKIIIALDTGRVVLI
jgi:hypothetical protein